MGKKKEKPPPLTPEEKKLLKEQKKLQAKLLLEEKNRQQKRDRLQREINYAHTNRKILEQKWRDTQMQILEPYFKLQYQIAVNKSEEVLDLKDYQISLLLDELEEADEQYNENFRGHMYSINKVILNDLKKDFETSFSNLMFQAMHERCKIQEKYDSDNEHLNVMIFRLAEENKTTSTTLQSVYTAKIKLEQKTTENEIEIMQGKKYTTFMDLWDMCTSIVDQYQERAKQQEKEYTHLYGQNNFYTNVIKNQTLQIFHNREKLNTLKEAQETEKQILDADIKCKIAERDFFKKIYGKLRSYYEEDKIFDEKQLTHLVTHSNIILKDLSKTADHCGKIVKHYSLIRKYETQQEKYLPYPRSMPSSTTVSTHAQTTHMTVNIPAAQKKDDLRGFWMKCGQIDASRYAIKEEYHHLKKQNASFKTLLGTYCSGFVHNCDTLQDKTLHLQCNIK